MPLINVSVQHHRTVEDARAHLASVVAETRGKFGPMIRRVDWAPDRDSVAMSGVGFRIDMRVDPESIHVTGDIPLVSGLLGGSMAKRIEGVVRDALEKLPSK
jgi:hypothetical protein